VRVLTGIAALAAVLSLPAAAAAKLLEPGQVRFGFGLGGSRSSLSVGGSAGYVVNPHLVPGIHAGVTFADPDSATAGAGITAYLLEDAGVNPYVDVSGGRLFVGGGLPDAWTASVGAGVMLVQGRHLGLSIGIVHGWVWFDDGRSGSGTWPDVGVGLYY